MNTFNWIDLLTDTDRVRQMTFRTSAAELERLMRVGAGHGKVGDGMAEKNGRAEGPAHNQLNVYVEYWRISAETAGVD